MPYYDRKREILHFKNDFYGKFSYDMLSSFILPKKPISTVFL
ncbi:hypothetical protein HMPREF1548_02098 [Clostridium sp. KLE 1755]|nr:hypothetical protein HMPREF1548_02098 [Clostridium sp. KLE 1755]